MNAGSILRTYIDVSFNLINVLKRYTLFSRYLSLFMDKDTGLNITFSQDLCLFYIKIDHKESKLVVHTKDIYLPDLISETYNISLVNQYPDYTPEKWFEKSFIEDLMKRYPKAFRLYERKSKISRELSDKYNVKIGTVIDYDGYMYTKIEMDIPDKTVKSISLLIERGIKIIAEYCAKTLSLPYDKRNITLEKGEPLDLILTWLNLSREIYKYMSNNNIIPKGFYLANYDVMIGGKPFLTVKYPYKDIELTITISKENEYYLVKYILPKDKQVTNLEEKLDRDSFKIEIDKQHKIYHRHITTITNILSQVKTTLSQIK